MALNFLKSLPALCFLSLLSLISSSSSEAAVVHRGPRALVAPVTKDHLTNLYSIVLNKPSSSFVIDLKSPFSWSTACPAKHPTIPCSASICSAAAAYRPSYCPLVKRVVKNPCACTVYTANNVAKRCGVGELTQTDVNINVTDGHNPTSLTTVRRVISACAQSSLLQGLPRGTAGVAGLARSASSLTSQLAAKLSLVPQFALCLPSVAFFGSPPFYLMQAPPIFELSSLVSYTPLLKNPTNSNYYYIGLRGIAINRETVSFSARVLEFDSLGHGGVVLDPIRPYTALSSHVYRPFLRSFAFATRGIPRAPKIPPFDLCLNTTFLASTRLGFGVPQIDFMLAGEKNWTAFGSNSLVEVAPQTACLAFVNSGPKAEHAVAVGGFQMENNFLIFDLKKSRLGFTSTLFGIRTTCSNFNFTSAI